MRSLTWKSEIRKVEDELSLHERAFYVKLKNKLNYAPTRGHRINR